MLHTAQFEQAVCKFAMSFFCSVTILNAVYLELINIHKLLLDMSSSPSDSQSS